MRSEQGTDDFKTFNYLENGDVIPSVYDTVETRSTIKPGNYTIDYESYPTSKIILKLTPGTESHSIVEFLENKLIQQSLDAYYNTKVIEALKKLGYLRKLGILLYGKEGTGKSSILKSYCTQLIQDHQAIVFHITNDHSLDKKWAFIDKIRKIQDNTIVLFFDEFDMIMDGDSESVIKSILDGYLSIDNFMCMAATNYIDKVPDAISKRLSRFKFCVEIGGVQDQSVIRSIILKLLEGLSTSEEIEAWSKKLVGKTIDEIKQFCLDKIMDIPIDESGVKTIGFKYD